MMNFQRTPFELASTEPSNYCRNLFFGRNQKRPPRSRVSIRTRLPLCLPCGKSQFSRELLFDDGQGPFLPDVGSVKDFESTIIKPVRQLEVIRTGSTARDTTLGLSARSSVATDWRFAEGSK
jgi:hypothetical protein